MPDREKVVSNLQGAYEYLRHFENTAKMGEWVSDALALLKEQQEQIDKLLEESASNAEMAEGMNELLKEQEARILDWDELEYWENAVWFEDKDEHECYIALIANVGTYDAKFTNVEPGNIHNLDFMRDFYMKEWRCWSARPTIKQRQDVTWE